MSTPTTEELITERKTLDVTCDPDDDVQVEVQHRPNGRVLYVHLNGITILRMCRIKNGAEWLEWKE